MRWGIYIHVPWCRRRCSYCDFYFEVGKPKESQAFVERVIGEFRLKSVGFGPTQASTLYFGGGTPSLLAPDELGTIVNCIKEAGLLCGDAEITLEANPEDLSLAYLHAIRALGVNRLSIGIQSFDNNILRYLGRKHNSQTALECLKFSMAAGFDNVSIDQIIGVPGEDMAAIKVGIDQALCLGVKHLSTYMLTVEEKTPLENLIAKKRRQAVNDDFQATQFIDVQKWLADKGIEQYEISSFSVPGFESSHNRIYWSKGQYLGLGPAAHSMQLQSNGVVLRTQNPKNLKIWLADKNHSVYEEETLLPAEALLEAAAFGLRDLKAGICTHSLEARHRSLFLPTFFAIIENFIENGWVEKRTDKIYLTPQGALFADAVCRDILSA